MTCQCTISLLTFKCDRKYKIVVAILAILAILAIMAILAIRAILAIHAILAILAILVAILSRNIDFEAKLNFQCLEGLAKCKVCSSDGLR